MSVYNEDYFTFIKILGQGVFSNVNLFEDKEKNKFAIKRIKKKENKSIQLCGKKEIQIYESFKTQSDFVIKFYGYYYCSNDYLHLIFEHMEYNLYEYQKSFKHELSLNDITKITYQMCLGIDFLHDYIIHRDLKHENIMINEKTQNIKIIDLGSSKLLKDTEDIFKNAYIVSRYYRAPELLYGIEYTKSIDIWSIGCILVELIIDFPLFPGKFQQDMVYKIAELIGVPNIYYYRHSSKFNNYWVIRPNFYDNINKYEYEEYKSDTNSYDYEFRHTIKTEKIIYKIPRKYNIKEFLDSQFPEIYNYSPNITNVKDFILSIITYEPSERPDSKQCLKHPMFLEYINSTS